MCACASERGIARYRARDILKRRDALRAPLTGRSWPFWQVDSLGVRTTAIFSCTMCVISRAVLVFGRSRASLYVAMFALSPAGDGTFNPCFTVGLKKCTTDVTRPFAYALAYTVANLGGAFSANLMDVVRLCTCSRAKTKQKERPPTELVSLGCWIESTSKCPS